jgi:hypothetical protein
MRSTFLGRAALASALIFAIGACGDSGSSGPDFDDEATTAETEEAADGAVEMMTDITYDINFGGPDIFLASSASAKRLLARHPELARGLGARVRDRGIAMPGLTVRPDGAPQLSAAPGCTITSSGTDGDPFDPYDGNSNGIPDDWHAKQVCVEKDSTDAENILTYTSTIEMAAKENTSAIHGFTASMSYSEKMSDQEGHAGGFELQGSETLDLRADHASSGYKFKVREYETFDGETEEFTAGEERNVSFDPDGTIALESDLPDGDLSVNARQWFAETDDLSLSFSIETTDPLAYDASCFDLTDPPFTDGTIVGRLNGGSHSAMFTVDFTACGTYSVEVDNTSDEPVVVTRRPAQGERAALGRR